MDRPRGDTMDGVVQGYERTKQWEQNFLISNGKLGNFSSNYGPPPHAACYCCTSEHHTIGSPMKSARTLKCSSCAGTGLNPLPIPEVISGLRRGTLVDHKAQIWNRWTNR